MYKVLSYFTDLQDGGHPYHEGDAYPREGLEVSEERLIELSTAANRRKKPLIEFIAEDPTKTEAPGDPESKPVGQLTVTPDDTPAKDQKKTTKTTSKKPTEKKSGNKSGTKPAKGKSGTKK
ncbi:MAG: hypothetical protein IKD59_09035 [Lachnospiraceae bacterium]|nr:hypothetical protein [Lachnospiraceae bacterium]MBR3374185.1 hypothetical protein [Bacillota bacterium]